MPRTAFVLSGGGNQAVSQVGMLRALLERDIVPDVLIGCSAGACNGAVIAEDPSLDGVERLAETWRSVQGNDLFPGGRFSRAWNIVRRGDHLFSDQGMKALIERSDTAERFEELAVPLRVVASDLELGEEVVFAAGPIAPALLASTALPGILPPVLHDGRRLVDGAVTDTVPLWHALSGPVDRVCVLSVAGELLRRPIRSPLDVVVRAFAISRKQRFELEMRTVPSTIELVSMPAPKDDRELDDFTDADRLMDAAYELGRRTLDELEARRPSRWDWRELREWRDRRRRSTG